MEYVVYVLHSESTSQRYVGFTSHLIERMRSHNHLSRKGFTSKYRPWKIVYLEFFKSKSEAITREKFFKSGQGRCWMKKQGI